MNCERGVCIREEGHIEMAPFTTTERFWAKVDKNGSIPSFRPDLGPCWLWKTGKNYGHFYANGRGGVAHRFSYELHKGPIPEGLTVDHLCRVRRCVNPSHLEVVTRKENVLRGFGTSATNARRTHCIHGHELTEANTYHPPRNPHQRHCRTCNRRIWGEKNEKIRKGIKLGPRGGPPLHRVGYK